MSYTIEARVLDAMEIPDTGSRPVWFVLIELTLPKEAYERTNRSYYGGNVKVNLSNHTISPTTGWLAYSSSQIFNHENFIQIHNDTIIRRIIESAISTYIKDAYDAK